MKQDKKKLYESIMTSVAKEVKKVLNENAYSEAELKMDAWHNGTRKQNVKACSDEKLKMNLEICLNKGYDSEAKQLQDEINIRMDARKNDIYIVVINGREYMKYVKNIFVNAIDLENNEVITNLNDFIKNDHGLTFVQLAPGMQITSKDITAVTNKSSSNSDLCPAAIDKHDGVIAYDDYDLNRENEGITTGILYDQDLSNATGKEWWYNDAIKANELREFIINIIKNYKNEGKNVQVFFLSDD